MSFKPYADGPGQIRLEGQQITIKFIRTSDTTGKVVWNIPPPVAGCDADSQAYDGIVVTIANVPANYIGTSPKDGVYYNADPTADKDLFLGDKLETALVIGAFYNDKKTTSLEITGLSPKTPYYVSGYAVDAQARYHREGVHAYSLPTGVGTQLTPDTNAYQDIQIFSKMLINKHTPTGLVAGKDYHFKIQMCCKFFDFTVKGSQALNYGDLVRAINAAFAMDTCAPQGPLPPNSGEYYLNQKDHTLQKWDGWKYIPAHLIWSEADPAIPKIGAYWYNPKNDTLYKYETSGWVVVTNIIKHKTDPTNVVCGQIWFDGTDAYEWDGNHWTKLCVIISERNPLFPPLMDCDTYWYDSKTQLIQHWSTDKKKWEPIEVIYGPTDPASTTAAQFWFNEKTSKMLIWEDTKYVAIPDDQIVYKGPTSTGRPPKIKFPEDIDTVYWLDTTNAIFHRADRDPENPDLPSVWVPVNFISFPEDPSNREKVNLWWNSVTDKLMVWDPIGNKWVQVQKFYQIDSDPRIPPVLPDCAIWYNPKTGKMTKILSADCEEVETIFSKYDPTNLPVGTIWRNGNVWKIWDGSAWQDLEMIIHEDDPYNHPDGVFWYNPDTFELMVRKNGAWVSVDYSSIDLKPKKGAYWFNTIDNQLMMWDGVTWIPSFPLAYVELKHRSCTDDYDFLRFSKLDSGCSGGDCNVDFRIVIESDNLFSHLKPSVMYQREVSGNSGLVGGPTYEQLGVGTDGSPVERRALADKIMSLLGAPSVTVELTKAQLDYAIDNALAMIRKHSSYGLISGHFFLDILPNQQVYRLVNECVGFNKIVTVKALRRARGTPFKGAYAWNDQFAYAALQQMYSMGTFDILTYHLTAAYMEELETLFAQRIQFQWNEHSRELRLFNWINNHERVLVEADVERTDQELLKDRNTMMWIQDWVKAEAYEMLANTRGKFQSLPGPNGATILNGQEMATAAQDLKTRLMEEIYDMNMQSAQDVGLAGVFVLG
jgi:hypothetical protein